MYQYKFSVDQLDILNRLIFDASIFVADINNLSFTGSVLELPIERRRFEDVTRKKFLWWTRTYLEGIASTLRFENVDNVEVSGSFDLEGKNIFISGIHLIEDGLSIHTASEVLIEIGITRTTRILLIDRGPSNIGKGIVEGRPGFTSSEWEDYLRLHQAENIR